MKNKKSSNLLHFKVWSTQTLHDSVRHDLLGAAEAGGPGALALTYFFGVARSPPNCGLDKP